MLHVNKASNAHLAIKDKFGILDAILDTILDANMDKYRTKTLTKLWTV